MKNIENYMLPCLTKKYLGRECLGCGIQRSFFLLLKGEFKEAFFMYPAIYPIVILAIVIIYNYFFKKKVKPIIIFILAILTIVVSLTNYLIKLNLL